MESLFNHRIVMSGWMFLAVILGSLWRSNSDDWNDLTAWLNKADDTPVAIAVALAVAGLGAPQAFGFLIERLSSVLGHLFGNIYPRLSATKAPERDTWYRQCLREAHLTYPELISRETFFRVLFYSYAGERMVDWVNWRNTQGAASGNAALSVLFGLLVSWIWFGAFDPGIAIVSSVVLVLLGYHAQSSLRGAIRVRRAWNYMIGPHVIQKELVPPTDTPRVPPDSAS